MWGGYATSGWMLCLVQVPTRPSLAYLTLRLTPQWLNDLRAN